VFVSCKNLKTMIFDLPITAKIYFGIIVVAAVVDILARVIKKT